MDVFWLFVSDYLLILMCACLWVETMVIGLRPRLDLIVANLSQLANCEVCVCV